MTNFFPLDAAIPCFPLMPHIFLIYFNFQGMLILSFLLLLIVDYIADYAIFMFSLFQSPRTNC